MDELVKRLRCSKYGSCPACPMWYSEEVEPNLWRERCAAIDAADAIEELLQKTQQLPRLIPVTEALPREGRYLALTTPFFKGGEPYARILRFAERLESVDKYDFGGLNRSGWYYYDDEYGHIEVDTVTHWMPLPEPPKGE